MSDGGQSGEEVWLIMSHMNPNPTTTTNQNG